MVTMRALGVKFFHKVILHEDVAYGNKRGMHGVVRNKLHKSTSNTFCLRAVCAEIEILQDKGSAAVAVATRAAARARLRCAKTTRRTWRHG